MDFLNPWYLAGAAAIIAPILLHLRRRPPKEFVPFSTLMFLEKTPERLTRRSKLEKLWLLLLRCAVLLLLALLFARPFFNSDKAGAGGGEGRRLVVLLDRSASMQREDLWERAVKVAKEILDDAHGRDEVVLATFDDGVELLNEAGGDVSEEGANSVTFARQVRALQAQLGDLEAGWGGSDLGGALIAAADLLEATGTGPDGGVGYAKEIVVISDFQEGAERDQLNRYAWPESVKVRCIAVEPEQPANLTLNLVATIREGESEADESGETAARGDEGEDQLSQTRRVRIRNARADGEEARFSLSWEGTGSGDDAVIKGSVPPGGSRVVTAPPRSAENSDGDGVLVLSGEGAGEKKDHDFDNRAWVARVQPRPIRVLYLAEKVDANDPGAALFYLRMAMQPTSVLTPEVEARAFSEVSASEIDAANVLVVAGAPEVEMAKRLGAATENGAALMWLLRSDGDAEGAAALSAASGIDGWKISEAKGGKAGGGEYAMLADLDFDAGVLVPFARAKVRDFSSIHVWKHRQLSVPVLSDAAQVLARYDGGDPAWVQLTRGAGRMYLFTSGWEPAESQLALSSKFVPLLYAMLAEAGFSALPPTPLVVGEPLPKPIDSDENGVFEVKLPSGDSVESKVNEGVFRATEEPGFYSVQHATGESVYAVNLAANEGRVDAFDPLTLADFSVPVRVEADEASGNADAAAGSAAQGRAAANREQAADERRRLEKSEKEQRQKLWKWLVLAVLVVLLLETWVAGRSGKSEAVAEGDADSETQTSGGVQHA